MRERCIVMTSDGKPSCIRKDGDHYMNSPQFDDRTWAAPSMPPASGSIPIPITFIDAPATLPPALHRALPEVNRAGPSTHSKGGRRPWIFRDHLPPPGNPNIPARRPPRVNRPNMDRPDISTLGQLKQSGWQEPVA